MAKYDAELSKLMKNFIEQFIKQATDGIPFEELPYIRTYTGKKFRYLCPREEDICIEDIAHHLSLLSRFCGATEDFYSVAQHSVLVSLYTEDALSGLLHDASEAYCNDLCRPFKRSPGMEAYRYYENNVTKAIQKKFGLPEESENIKKIDAQLLATEQQYLYSIQAKKCRQQDYHFGKPIDELVIIPWQPKAAEQIFLSRFKELQNENKS